MPIDVAIFQHPEEIEEFGEWLGGRRAGRDVTAIYLEHNAPQGWVNEMRHPIAGRDGFHLVHVTHFNALFWDSGDTPVRVVEHGIVDPGYRYSGELPRCAIAINEASRRGRVTGTDLLPWIERHAPYDLFGIGTSRDLPQAQLHDAMARRRVYVHPYRWTSLGLSLLEAMHLGMPVVALATTEVPAAVPATAGVVSNRLDVIADALHWLMKDRDAARKLGERARAYALARYGVHRFLADWDTLLSSIAC